MTMPDAGLAGDATALAAALAELGVHCTVEAHGRLALLAAPTARALEAPAARRRAAALAAAHGFTHVALELREAVAP